jgi:protein involved in polysaccharide export with SLBB domain
VTVLSELPISIYVLGQVQNPGPVKVRPQASLQEIIESAGGMTEFSNYHKIKIVHRGQSDEDASYYDLQSFLNTGNLALLPKIMEGDRVIVLSSLKTNKIKVLGAVNKPGFYLPHDSTNVFDMVYLAGGPTQDANLTKIRVLGNENGRETDAVVNLRDYIDEGKLSDVPRVSPGDVVIVYRKSFTWSKSLTIVRDIVALVTAWFVISQLFK